MKSLIILLSSTAAVLAVSPFAGVNIAGFDFGVDIQGTHNLTNAQGPVRALGDTHSDGIAQMQHFVQNDQLNTFRLPTTWQFMINSRNLNGSATTITGPSSNGTLNATNAAQYDQLVQGCLATGASCVIDIHNYARFEGQVIGQGGPTNAQFAMLWSQIAAMYRDEPKVMFGIMNEPHDIPNLSAWADTVQSAVTAIRNAGATSQTILLPGTDFTHAATFIDNGSAGNLSRVHNPDGTNTSLVFEVHQYLDSDGSGTALECVTDHVQDAFMPLSQFLVANGRKALLGEIGGGNTTSCLTDLCSALAFINANPKAFMGYAGWAAGGFSATDYNLTMTPKGTAGNFTDQQTVSQCVVGMRAANQTRNSTSVGTGSRGTQTHSNATRAGPSTGPTGGVFISAGASSDYRGALGLTLVLGAIFAMIC